ATFSDGLPMVSTGVLCAKASMLLQDVSPPSLLRFLREHRSQWADSSLDAFFASALKPNFSNLPMSRLGGFSGQVILPLAHTSDPEEVSSWSSVNYKIPCSVVSPCSIF
uniref:START domain-containing protein n=1 Tax=Aegilops tauschii subsp. strangulata TaxID=200361 RepID=A0A453ED96_AEGTS